MWPLIENRPIFGIEIPDNGAYPKNQRMVRMIMIAINISYFVSRSFDEIG